MDVVLLSSLYSPSLLHKIAPVQSGISLLLKAAKSALQAHPREAAHMDMTSDESRAAAKR